ncbi:MAG: ThuA domain-containing protein, partial [Pirellulales bacterium]
MPNSTLLSRSALTSIHSLFIVFAVLAAASNSLAAGRTPHVVFVTGDEEYRSEESMPMLAKILHRDYRFRISIAYSLDKEGHIDPNNTTDATGIEALATADLMVLFTRFRHWPDDKFQRFLDYVAEGKPIVGFRTATHAFRYPADHRFAVWNENKIAQLVGQKWITHHGHHGTQILTKIRRVEAMNKHPILRGVEPFDAYSWLYHVQGGVDQLHGDSQPLMIGRALKSKYLRAKNTERFPLEGPVAWIKTYRAASGKQGRVFFSTAAHPYDFKAEANRKLALNGILWALGLEKQIPAAGCNTNLVDEYEPNDAGFGTKFKQNRKPENI